MKRPYFYFSYQGGANAIKALTHLDSEVLEKLKVAVKNSTPTLDSANLRAIRVCREIDRPDLVEDVQAIFQHVIDPAQDMKLLYDMSTEDIFRRITDSMPVDPDFPEWDEKDLAILNDRKSYIVDLLNLPGLDIEAKARSLVDSRPNRVIKFRIFSDVRPLFSEDASIVVYNLVIDTLYIQYSDADSYKELHLSVDPGDLSEFLRQVERGRAKNQVLFAQGDGKPIPVLRAKDDDSETDAQRGPMQ